MQDTGPQVSYFSYEGCDGQFFRCDPYRATLQTTTCAKRWREAQSAKGAAADRYSLCRSCPIGAAHAGEATVHYSSFYDTDICPRCLRGATRLINGTRCISCYNREREFVSGKNAKGTAPVKLRPLAPRTVRYAVEGHGETAPVREFRAALTVDTEELLVLVLRSTKGRIVFGFRGRSPELRQGRLL